MSERHQVIDLVSSDEESSDERRPSTNSTRLLHMPSTSNHGLPSTSAAARASWTNNRVLGTNYMINGAQYGAPRPATISRTDSVPTRPQYRASTSAAQAQSYRGDIADPRRRTMATEPQQTGIKRQKTSHVGELPRQQQHLSPQVNATQQPVPSDNSSQRISYCLNKQLIPHVTKALQPYREYLQKADRVWMGGKIAGALVSEETFMEDLGENDRISDTYERYIIRESQDRAAKEFRKLQLKGKAFMPELPLVSNLFHGTPQGSETSTETEEVFDTKSVSQDLMDMSPANTSPERDDEDMEEPRALPKRASRAENPIYTRQKRARVPNRPKPQFMPATHYPGPQGQAFAQQVQQARQAPTAHIQQAYQHAQEAPIPPIQQACVRQDHVQQFQQAHAQVQVQIRIPQQQKIVESVELSEGLVLEEYRQTRNHISKKRSPSPDLNAVWVRPPPRVKRNPIGQLLREREIHGVASGSVRAQSGQSSFKSVVSGYFEDNFIRQTEWHNCSGTLLSLTWTSPDAFICGAVAHVDTHHMQYNKPGNLLLGSAKHDTLRAYSDHRVIRPIVSILENANNALEAMRTTQDPWMYEPVASTAHCDYSGLTFTASFDKTVKVWSLMEDGSSMILEGTWEHDNRVNFVATSKHHDRVATASESMTDAVRVYLVDEDSISHSSYDSFCGNKASTQGEEIRRREKWSYKPSTIQWGATEVTSHLLLVGWSPRSDSGDDSDIPEASRNTGELCVWNSGKGETVPINSTHVQNVFEVLWHPTKSSFLAATSPSGTFDVDRTKTQIRLFGLNSIGTAFINTRTFDCPGSDINELTIMPTSIEDCYVTVSCTDSCTYVYDSKAGDQPIHVLQHCASLDEEPEAENEKAGVKFAAWGNSGDRFYTGSSDGELKAWDVKAPPGKAFVRNVVTLSGGIYAGAFSEDFSKLIIGDDSGKVHLLAIDDRDLEENPQPSQGKLVRRLEALANEFLPSDIRRPKLVIPHKDPVQSDASLGVTQAKKFLNTEQLVMVGNSPYQGPNYDETLLYRCEAHEDSDAFKPLLPKYLSDQQFQKDEQDKKEYHERETVKQNKLRKQRLLATIHRPSIVRRDTGIHQANLTLDLAFEKLSLSTQHSLTKERTETKGDYVFDYEIMPSESIFATNYV